MAEFSPSSAEHSARGGLARHAMPGLAGPRPGQGYSPPVGKKMVVTVLGMDGKTDVFDDVDPVHVADGVLIIRERKPWWSAGSAEAWNLSMANIRSYSADWVKRQ
jgi:hypothetical protein